MVFLHSAIIVQNWPTMQWHSEPNCECNKNNPGSRASWRLWQAKQKWPRTERLSLPFKNTNHHKPNHAIDAIANRPSVLTGKYVTILISKYQVIHLASRCNLPPSNMYWYLVMLSDLKTASHVNTRADWLPAGQLVILVVGDLAVSAERRALPNPGSDEHVGCLVGFRIPNGDM